VVIEVDGKALLAAPDGVAVITEQASKEIYLQNHYADDELKFVKEDDVFKASCEQAFLKVRDAASGREKRDARVTDKGKTPSATPYRWKVGIRYTRPGTRNWREKVLKE